MTATAGSEAGAGDPEARQRIRDQLGRFGVWIRDDGASPEFAQQVEGAGFSALWIGRAGGDLRLIEELIEATERLTVATGIVNIWTTDPVELTRSVARVEQRFPGRLVLGLGAGHAESVGARYARPYSALVAYLDQLDEVGFDPSRCLLAALGPRMLALAGSRAAGAHSYLVTPAHTSEARSILGRGAVLAPDQKVIMAADADEAYAIAGPRLDKFAGMANYRAHLGRMGYTEFTEEVRRRIVDELMPWGDAASLVERVEEQLRAGADHVAVQVLGGPDDDLANAYQQLGAALSSRAPHSQPG